MNATLTAAEDIGITERIVYKEMFPKDQTDFRTTLLSLRKKQVDAVVVLFFSGSLSSFAKQFRASSISAELIGMESFEDPAEVEAAVGALDGCWYVNAADPQAWFIKDYRKRYGSEPAWGSANGYDALTLLAAAVSATDDSSKEVVAYLRAVKDYAGAAGTHSASGDNRFTLPAALKRVTATGFESFAIQLSPDNSTNN